MGVQVNLQDIQSGFLTAAAHTANNTLIETAMNKALDRTASTDNAMEVNLDMGNQRGINAADGLLPSDLVNLRQLQGSIAAAGSGLIASQFETQKGSAVSGGVSTFSSISYTLGGNNLFVFRNGVKQTKGRDYSETSTTSITWITVPNASDDLDFITNISTTTSVTDTSAISHTDGTTYNLAAYLNDALLTKTELAAAGGSALVGHETTNVNNALNSKPYYFATVSDAQAAAYLVAGNSIQIGDRNGSFWDVSSSGTANGYDVISLTGSGLFATLRMYGFVSVEAFGVKHNTESTGALNRAFVAACDNKFTLTGTPGAVYLYTPSEAFGINLQSKTWLQFLGRGCSIKAVDAAATAANGVILWLENCSGVYIEDVIFDGNLSTRTGSEGAGAHCVKIRSGSDIEFNKVGFLNSVSDGLYVDTVLPEDVTTNLKIIDCYGDGCYRNNVSIIDSEGLRVIGGRYDNADGTLPKAGIDLEDNGGYGNKNFIIDGPKFEGNQGCGLVITGVTGCADGIVRNISFKENELCAMKVGKSSNVSFDGIDVFAHTGAITRGIIDVIAAGSESVTLKDINFYEANPTGTGKSCLYTHSNNTSVDIDGVSIFGTNATGLLINHPNAKITNVTVRDSTINAPINVASARADIKNITQINCAVGSIVSRSDSTVDGFTSVDCAGNFSLWMIGSSPVILNAITQQTVSIPAGSKAYVFSSPPKMLSNINAKSAGTDYTSANIFDFLSGSAGTVFGVTSPVYP